MKSVGVGLLSVLGFALVSPLVFVAITLFLPAPREGGSWGWDPVAFIKSPLSWVILMLVFVTGFVWEYRHL